MGEDQALKTEDTPEANPADTEEQLKASEEVEVVIDGEDKPSSKTVPVGFLKRINKLNGKVSAATQEAEELKRQNEMLTAERDLYKTKDQQKAKLNPDDFNSDAEYEAAKLRQELPGLVEEKAKALLAQKNQSDTQTAYDRALETSIVAHYERAEKLKVSDYEATEDKAIDIFGPDISKHIMAKSDKSEVLMYYFGKNPDKAQGLKRLMETDIVKGVLELGRLEEKVKPRPKRPQTPDPETEVEGGGGVRTKAERGPKGAKFW